MPVVIAARGDDFHVLSLDAFSARGVLVDEQLADTPAVVEPRPLQSIPEPPCWINSVYATLSSVYTT